MGGTKRKASAPPPTEAAAEGEAAASAKPKRKGSRASARGSGSASEGEASATRKSRSKGRKSAGGIQNWGAIEWTQSYHARSSPAAHGTAADQAKRMERAQHERMYLVRREDEDPLNMQFLVQGASKRQYRVIVDVEPRCACPDGRVRKLKCKHLLFVLRKALGVPENHAYFSRLDARARMTEQELRRIHHLAPNRMPDAVMLNPPDTDAHDQHHHDDTDEDEAAEAGGAPAVAGRARKAKAKPKPKAKAKPKREVKEVPPRPLNLASTCGICFEDLFTADGVLVETTAYCSDGCGQHVHEECFERWSAQRLAEHQTVVCVYCRKPSPAEKRLAVGGEKPPVLTSTSGSAAAPTPASGSGSAAPPVAAPAAARGAAPTGAATATPAKSKRQSRGRAKKAPPPASEAPASAATAPPDAAKLIPVQQPAPTAAATGATAQRKSSPRKDKPTAAQEDVGKSDTREAGREPAAAAVTPPKKKRRR